MAGPLGGVKVIELGTMAAVPGGAAILAEWGADVLKVEDPGGGDPARTLNVIPDAAGRGEAGPLWEQANRNKRSAAIDIRNERGRATLLKLVEGADVFVTSTRYAGLERGGLAYEDLRAVNERIIYCHLSGYGREGEEAWRPGYDALCYWSRSGLADSLTPGGPDAACRSGPPSATTPPPSPSPPGSARRSTSASAPARARRSGRRCSTPACG